MVATETDTKDKKTSTVSVQVTVEDANDNYPVFAQKVYKASVPENAPKGTSVITITVSTQNHTS